jgi:hypothetical protein
MFPSKFDSRLTCPPTHRISKYERFRQSGWQKKGQGFEVPPIRRKAPISGLFTQPAGAAAGAPFRLIPPPEKNLA